MAYTAVDSLPDKDIYYSFPSVRKAAFARTQVQVLILTTIQPNKKQAGRLENHQLLAWLFCAVCFFPTGLYSKFMALYPLSGIGGYE